MLKNLTENRVAALSLVVQLVSALVACSIITAAQQVPDSQKSSSNITSSAPEISTRSHRVQEPVNERTAEVNKPDLQSPASESKVPVSDLRDQIAAAKTPLEQTRLRFELVDQLLGAGLKSEAGAELRAMVAQDRFDPTTFYNLGNRLVRLGDLETAVSSYRKAIDQRKGNYSRALNNLGAALLQLGRWDEAHSALSSALRLEKFRYAEASFNLGRLYAARGETDLAIREWQRALAANPQHSGAARELANAKSEGRIRVAAATKAPPEIRSTASPVKVARAVKPIARTLTVDQATYDLLQKGRTAHERGRDEEAVGYYRSVLSHMGGYFAPANLELSYSLITLKRNDEAIALLRTVSTNDGALYPVCYYHLARLYEVRGELKVAEENYTRAAAIYSANNFQFLLDLSRVREKLGDLQGAQSALEQYVQAAEKAGRRPDWSDARLAELRKKINSSTATTTAN
jgi:tetratricopeptide (TPR) repeat protein